VRAIKYIGNSRIGVECKHIHPEDIVYEGDIPQDAFEFLSCRNDFEWVDGGPQTENKEETEPLEIEDVED
jgi:hypothetical protein